MVTYPIHIRRDAYRGSDSRKKVKRDTRNQLAQRLEAHINEKLKRQVEPIRVYTYSELSLETGIEFDIVRDLGYSIDCGSGGFTAYRSGLTQEQAMNEAAGSSGSSGTGSAA